MKSATEELLKYFRRKEIGCIGDPYVEFRDVVAGPAVIHANSFYGLMHLVRITSDGGRWFVQWWVGRNTDAGTLDPDRIIAVLEKVVAENYRHPSTSDFRRKA